MIFDTGLKSDVVTNKGTGLVIPTVASALKINSIEGKSVQDGTPTPDAPVDINSVKVGAVTVSGRNILYNSDTYVGWFVNGNTTLNAIITSETYKNGKVLKYITPWAYIYPPKKTYKAGTYTISFDAKLNISGSGSAYISGMKQNKMLVISGNTFKRYSYTFTLSEDVADTYISVFIPSNPSYGELYVANIQLEENTVATPYEPYKENKLTLSAPVTLRSLGNVKDVICKQGNVWGVLRRVGNVVLNGTETWTATTLNRIYTGALLKTIKKPIDNKTKGNARSTHYAIRGKDGLDTGCFGIETTGALFFLDNTNATSVSTWTAWLAANSVIVEYELNTPVFTALPDADQNVFNSLRSYDGVTVITTDSTVEPELCVTNAVSLTGAYALDSVNALGGCKFKYENGKFYIGYDDGTAVVETEV